MRKNSPESQFEMTMMKQGYGISKRGWPDFLCYLNGKVICVEVKAKSTHMPSKPQKTVMSMLIKHGIDCYMWSPDSGLVQVKE